MTEDEKPPKKEKITIQVERDFYKVLDSALFLHKDEHRKLKMSEFIRAKLAQDPEIRAVAESLGVNMDAFITKTLGGYRPRKGAKEGQGKAIATDAPQPPTSAPARTVRSFSKVRQVGSKPANKNSARAGNPEEPAE